MRKNNLILTLFILMLSTASFAAPNITHIEVTTLTDDSAVITWRTTGEASDTNVHYGVGIPTQTYSLSESTMYHYALLENLFPGTNYEFFIESTGPSGTSVSDIKSFTTLTPPSGTYLFTFATITDSQVATDVADTYGARGRPYSTSEAMLGAAVDEVNAKSPAFTIVKGDLIDDHTSDPDAQATKVRNKLSALSSLYGIPGNHDKDAFLPGSNTDWYTKLFKPIFGLNASAEADATQDSIYNSSFDYQGVHFVLLDCIRNEQKPRGHVDIGWLRNDLAQNSGKMTFVFLHNAITQEGVAIPDVVLEEVIGETPVNWAKVDVDNRQDFLDTLNNHKDQIAGVFMGHIHDNSKFTMNDIVFVRTAAVIQFPVGYNIYKVYSNGYIQSFYKVPYYTEIARDNISAEAGYSKSYFEQFSLGPVSFRNFSHELENMPPGISITYPTNNATQVPTNSNIKIEFTKAMDRSTTENAITISPSSSGVSYSWDAFGKALTISHSGFQSQTSYTITISTAAEDTTGRQLASQYSFSFTSAANQDTNPPIISINNIPNDIYTDILPTFTGIATDEASIVTDVECRIDGGTFEKATPIDGSFNSKQENFIYTPSQALSRKASPHLLEVRAYDSSGNVNTTYPSYSFYIIGNRPEILLASGGNKIISGDPIDPQPSFEVTVVTSGTLSALSLSLDSISANILPDSTHPGNNQKVYFATYSPSTALSDGSYTVRVTALDMENNISTKEAKNLLVENQADAQVRGLTLNYPNPFNPEQESTNISYILNKNIDIKIYLYSLNGVLVSKMNYPSAQNGGRAGYNEIVWNGRSDLGDLVGNGIYIYTIIGEGRILAKGKITVIKR